MPDSTRQVTGPSGPQQPLFAIVFHGPAELQKMAPQHIPAVFIKPDLNHLQGWQVIDYKSDFGIGKGAERVTVIAMGTPVYNPALPAMP